MLAIGLAGLVAGNAMATALTGSSMRVADGQALPIAQGDEVNEEPYCKQASDTVSDCVEVTADMFFFSVRLQSWRPARAGDRFEAGTVFCPNAFSRSMCEDWLRVHRDGWEKDREASCGLAMHGMASAIVGAGLAAPSCATLAVALLATSTGVGAPIGAPTAAGAAVVCALGSAGVIVGSPVAKHALRKCQARYPGPTY